MCCEMEGVRKGKVCSGKHCCRLCITLCSHSRRKEILEESSVCTESPVEDSASVMQLSLEAITLLEEEGRMIRRPR